MERADAAFGIRVVASDRLERHVDHGRKRDPEDRYARRGGDWKGWVYRGKRWSGVSSPKPVEGILVGIRYVHESGWRVWNGEDGISWEPEGEKRAQALVATDLQHDPVRVWLDDLVLTGTSAESRVSMALSYLESEAYYDAKPHKAHRDLEAVRRVLAT
ncbi:hypothetical protein PBI_TEAMOCIL_77 [Microbacterium phage Teamocil]|uniref:Uncharacterized protein n=1 Tax=Microbacterium phage Teamocil TaxID=2656554 RepID=A0A649VYG9_9CAUD|nr:hypothetical protein QDA12_gp77 [Microbacterium phage Teamocil]QGJ88928.1 hypothetical protein PBI_GINA_77 [Microbacterium phage Gina]QGJ97025.1 hypothetical protein PBI_TEAMOCIL_77 [Microbacterium phage Teamocil]